MAENLVENPLKHASLCCIMVGVDTDRQIVPMECSMPFNRATVAVDCNVNRLSIMDHDRGEEMPACGRCLGLGCTPAHGHRLGLGCAPVRTRACYLGLGCTFLLGPRLHACMHGPGQARYMGFPFFLFSFSILG